MTGPLSASHIEKDEALPRTRVSYFYSRALADDNEDSVSLGRLYHEPKKRVWTLSTLSASDQVLLTSNCYGFRVIPRVLSFW